MLGGVYGGFVFQVGCGVVAGVYLRVWWVLGLAGEIYRQSHIFLLVTKSTL